MINFIGSEAQIGHIDRQLTTVQTKAGTNAADKMKNIYDLEGNNWEWTAQASLTNYRVNRGGYYVNTSVGGFHPASSRNGSYPNGTLSNYASRVSLYVSL